MMQTTVNIDTKTDLKSSIIVGNTDFCCLRDHCLSHNTFANMQIQNTTTKKYCFKEF